MNIEQMKENCISTLTGWEDDGGFVNRMNGKPKIFTTEENGHSRRLNTLIVIQRVISNTPKKP